MTLCRLCWVGLAAVERPIQAGRRTWRLCGHERVFDFGVSWELSVPDDGQDDHYCPASPGSFPVWGMLGNLPKMGSCLAPKSVEMQVPWDPERLWFWASQGFSDSPFWWIFGFDGALVGQGLGGSTVRGAPVCGEASPKGTSHRGPWRHTHICPNLEAEPLRFDTQKQVGEPWTWTSCTAECMQKG